MTSILIIDDDEQVRNLLQRFLQKAGYETVTAVNGNEGIRAYKAHPSDLIITDLIMPDKEGLETIMDLRRDFPHAKIIAISGGGRNTPENYLDVAQKLGAVRTFSKPVNRNELIGAVRDIIGPADA